MSFTNKIAGYTNSTTGFDVTGALNKGIDYTIGVTASLNPSMLRLFAYKINLGTHDGVELDFMETYNLSHLIDVQRGLKFCRPVTDRQLSDIVDPTSIYYALADDPVYFLDGGGKLTIKPATANADATRGYLFAVPHSGGRSVDDTNELIRITGWTHNGESKVVSSSDDSGFPDVLYELVVMHASECLLMERMVDFRAKLPTDLDGDQTLFDAIADINLSLDYTFPSTAYQDALTKAQYLIDKTASVGDDGTVTSAQAWLEDEDEDMVASTLSVASQELQRAQAILGEFNSELSAQTTSKGQELTEFQTNLQKKMALFDKIISKITVDYTWTSQQIQMLVQKKQEFIQTHLKLGPQGSPEGESKV